MIGYNVKSHLWRLPVLGIMLAGALLVTSGTAQAVTPPTSVPLAAQSASAVAAQAPAPTQMTPTQWRALKAGLDSSKEFTHQVSVSAGVRTHAYTYTSGSTVVLREPIGAVAAATPFAAMAPSVDVHGCGFLTLCLDLNKTDQEALTNGSSAALGVAICLLPAVGQVACGFVATALAIGATYVSHNGLCANKLQLTLGPVPGKGGLARCV